MKERLKFFGALVLYWFSFFTIGRILFLLYLFAQTSQLSWSEIMTPLFLGLRMDAAMAGYWLLLPGLIFMVSVFISQRMVYLLAGIVTTALLFVSTLITVADIELYKHWGFRINSTPLMYLESEAMSSVNPTVLIVLISIFTILLAFFLYIYWKMLAPLLLTFQKLPVKWAPVWLAITGALIIPIRSSFNVAPLNTGFVYFHKTKAFPNHAGINPVWNFFKSLSGDDNHSYPNNFYRSSNLNQQFDSLIQTHHEVVKLLSVEKPNIVLIILESFTSKIIEPLGGIPNITPELNSLIKEGILFENFYASGDRTDKGLVSILSGYPAQPATSIIKYPAKTQYLPYLPKVLKKNGYRTSFVYGGHIGFANMESYLTQAGFGHITDVDEFENKFDDSKWGVADQYVFNRLLNECDSAKSPFFKVMLSLSSHEPFKVPMETVIEGSDESSLFLNACYYTDKSLGEFILRAKNKPWWNKTLVIITADHGHRFPNPKELKEKERFKIPMLWLGGAIQKADTTIRSFGNQTDLANTLLNQLNIHSTEFSFSRNMLSQNANSFAMYIFNNGYGYVSASHENIYDFDLQNYLKQEGNLKELARGKIYMQKLFDDYNKK
ncbi:MAG: sulfatase-like hydrolase/transferase [Cyclobacteriaceae bacterium]|nr:sulfatase-like hydrolase/transferase [Cyclobacteriaceae bacterium]